MKYLLLLLLAGTTLTSFSQNEKKLNNAGNFELGLRSTFSTFGSTGNLGKGIGGQFRIRMSDRVNTEWFADFITENIDDDAIRHDYHIGWSVIFYPLNTINKKVNPYILAGHCFDYTKIKPSDDYYMTDVSRLSAATQIGIGTHFNISERLNLSLSSQYMLHLGPDIHVEIHDENGIKELHIDKDGHEESFSLEGHILFTISINYKLANLW